MAIDSKHLASMGHDPDAQRLEVEFANGHVWQYEGVSETEFEAILANKSRGSAFSSIVRGVKPGKRIA